MPKKNGRKYVITHAHNLSALYEDLAGHLPKEDSYGRGLFHGYADALKHLAEMLDERE